jgi:hypothetical protein
MDNLTTTISFSIYSNKGVYALLLGSGISKTSGIPTGWDIIIALIKKLAKLNNDECLPDPEKWFKEKYGIEPDYSTILEKLVPTPSERVNYLKPYFEPTEDEIEQHLKEPSKAHKAIAKLVKKGYIKVIITTNFDRLLENALVAEGIQPTVIKHAQDINGAMPLVHSDFTLVKVNGDYLDTRFLNTKEELLNYDSTLYRYILSILNDYGIISCGWSAKWDSGLIGVIRQCEYFRFSSYWTHIGKCENELNEISDFRKGKAVEIKGADDFFHEISEKIEALESINDDHPLTTEIAIARLKKYIAKDEYKILLHDLLLNLCEKSYNRIKQNIDLSKSLTQENIQTILFNYELSVDTLLPIIINGVYWCKPEHYQSFVEIISRISKPLENQNGIVSVVKQLFYYPLMLLTYSIGIVAIKVKKFDLLNLFFQLKIDEYNDSYSEKKYLIEMVNPCAIGNRVDNVIRRTKYYPLGKIINKALSPYFKEIFANHNEYDDLFNIFEYMFSLNYVFQIDDGSAPYGAFHWRNRGFRDDLLDEFFKEADSEQSNWLPIKAGMFDGNYSKYIETKKKTDEILKRVPY